MNIYDLLKESRVEKDVEEKYRVILREHFPTCTISSPYRTDGYLVVPELNLTMLMEIKHNLNFSKRFDIVNVLIQLIYYLKQFESHGDELPKVLFGGDINECFCLHSNITLPYLNENLDWTIQPSIAHTKNPVLSKKIYDDQNIKPYVHSISDRNFNFGNVVLKINQINQGITQKVHITELNINRYFNYFMERVIILNRKKHTPDDAVSIFLGCLTDSSNNYPHPVKKNRLVTQTFGELIIDKNNYDSFFGHFETHYSVEEKKRLTSICDRLIEDETRRFGGEFYTPTEWVNEAHKMIEEQFGLDWKEKYVVWDPAWGTGNLTRDYHFKELYCSTINHGDLSTAQHYNPEAVKFQYDFLNDDVIQSGILPVDRVKLPVGLVNALKDNKPIIIFMNPPYIQSNNEKTKGATNSMVRDTMIKENISRSDQLFCQFIYRCINIMSKNENANLCMFTNSKLFSHYTFHDFRNYMLTKYKYQSGFLINASHFSDVSNRWSISFSVLKKETQQQIDQHYDFNVLEIIDSKIEKSFCKTIIDAKENIFDWAKKYTQYKFTRKYPRLKNAIVPFNSSSTINDLGNCPENLLGYLSVIKLQNTFSILSSISTTSGLAIIPENFMKSMILFISVNNGRNYWHSHGDCILNPNEQHPEYQQWNNDAIIHSLFNGASNQASLRKVSYSTKLWDIKNQFFWMSKDQMLHLANENGYDELYHDANTDQDRFVFNKLQTITLSDDAKVVLNKAIELVIKTFPYRQQLHEEYPEWHLHTWDAGWYQIKKILNIYFKDDLKEFNQLYKLFEDRMREGVYKFGFLK